MSGSGSVFSQNPAGRVLKYQDLDPVLPGRVRPDPKPGVDTTDYHYCWFVHVLLPVDINLHISADGCGESPDIQLTHAVQEL